MSLTQSQALIRKISISSGITYKVFLNLNKGEIYEGLIEGEFFLNKLTNVFLDYTGQSIKSLIVNEEVICNQEIKNLWKDGHIDLPKSSLKLGSNKYQAFFESKYNKDGYGLHSYVSESDQVVYSQSEPYWCNRIYPLFDQPDLKGTMEYHILSPKDWIVLSTNYPQLSVSCLNSFQEKIYQNFGEKFTSDKKYTHFEKTPVLPSYLFSFLAGRFDQIQHPLGKDISIYAQPEQCEVLLKHDKVNTIFEYLEKSQEFYEDFFQTKYQFEKLDIIFLPDYNGGAMENPGLVTFSDDFIYQNPSQPQITNRGLYLSHELAHMWFGDYVTMKWWDDLWLNEAFADFAAFTCVDEISDKLSFTCDSGWVIGHTEKIYGYNEDKRITTHPIACVVENTNQADAIFDAITYQKGASVMKQLLHVVGKEEFSKNLGVYFEKYGWSNASRDEFLEEIFKNFSHQEMEEWTTTWIKKESLNVVEAQWGEKANNKQKIILHQKIFDEKFPIFRKHRIQVAFYDKEANVIHVETVLLQGEKIEIEIPAGDYVAILPNYQDWSFIDVKFDQKSLQFFSENTLKIKDTLSKMLILKGFGDMAIQAEISPFQLNDFILAQFIIGTDQASIVQQGQESSSVIEQCLKSKKYDDFKNQNFDNLMDQFNRASLDVQKAYLGMIIDNAVSLQNIKKVIELFDNKELYNEDQFQRIIFRLSINNQSQENDYKEYIEKIKTDHTKNNQTKFFYQYDSYKLNKEESISKYREFVNNWKDWSRMQQFRTLIGLTHENKECIQEIEDMYFENLPKAIEDQQNMFISNGHPDFKDKKEAIEKLRAIADKVDKTRQKQKNQLLRKIDNLEKIKNIQEKFNL